MDENRLSLILRAVGAWIVTLLLFFPLGWLVLTSFKTELQAIHVPPLFIFEPTLDNFTEVQRRSDYLLFARNSLITSIGSTIIGLAIAAPAAYSMAFFRTRRTRDILMWMLSTKMMPAVGVLVPMYLLFRDTGLLDTRLGLVILFTLSNLPIVVWMLYSFFKDVPHEILEAGRMDGARVGAQIRHLLLPLTLPGIASTALLSIILCWNEAFWSLNLTASQAAHRLHRLVLQPRGPVLGQALGGLDARRRPHPCLRLDHAAPARARPHLRCREVIRPATSQDMPWPS